MRINRTHKRDVGNWSWLGRCGERDVRTASTWKAVTCKKCLSRKKKAVIWWTVKAK